MRRQRDHANPAEAMAASADCTVGLCNSAWVRAKPSNLPPDACAQKAVIEQPAVVAEKT